MARRGETTGWEVFSSLYSLRLLVEAAVICPPDLDAQNLEILLSYVMNMMVFGLQTILT